MLPNKYPLNFHTNEVKSFVIYGITSNHIRKASLYYIKAFDRKNQYKVPKTNRLFPQKIRPIQNTCVYKLETRVRLFSGFSCDFFSGFSFAAGTISEWINERRFAGNHQGRLQFICEPIFYGATIRPFFAPFLCPFFRSGVRPALHRRFVKLHCFFFAVFFILLALQP